MSDPTISGDRRITDRPSLGAESFRLRLKQLVWHLNGSAGRSIVWRIKLLGLRYDIAVGIARRVCRGNKYGAHTNDPFVVEPVGGHCLCVRTRRRFDYIPF